MGLTRLSGHRARSAGFCTLAVTLDLGPDGKLPTEVRLFKAGPNATRKGEFLFDELAAELVMAAYAEHGVDVMLDLEHMSLDDEAPNYDPDARGYGKLELRNGELWLVSISYAGDGAERVKTRTQRFVSPAFDIDSDRRIVEVFNVALTSMPATDFAMPLAASRNDRGNKMDPKLLKKLSEMLRNGVEPEKALETLAIDMKTLQAVVKAMGGDPAGDLGALLGSVQSFAKELSDMASGKKAEEPKAEESAPAEEPAAMAASRSATAELETLRNEAAKQAKLVAELKAERDAREMSERVELVAELVKLGRETPATAWADPDGRMPRGHLRSMPIVELRERVESFRALGAIGVGAAAQPPKKDEKVTVVNSVNISEFEQNRIRATADREGGKFEVALNRYADIKRQQTLGAADKADDRLARMVSRPLTQADVLTDTERRPMVTLAVVKPIEEFGATSQRALEEFRLEYMATLASLPQVWAETIGDVLSSGALKETYPIDFAVSKYAKKTNENAVARTANVKEISVSKDEYLEAETCELRRLVRGDFAYLRSWDQKAARMARARQFLRNHMVATLLEANGNWVDGVAFFATNHKVDPFDAARTFRGSATWSNLQSGDPAPLSSTTLTAEKNLFLYSTPGPDGEEMGYEADAILFPTILNETARNLLSVQDLILEGAATAPTRNPHYQSGMEMARAPELTGTAVTANWYIFSRSGIASGLIPWVLSEDPSEEVRIWDETSDFYKGSGFIKYESHVLVSAALVYPHAMRKVLGT